MRRPACEFPLVWGTLTMYCVGSNSLRLPTMTPCSALSAASARLGAARLEPQHDLVGQHLTGAALRIAQHRRRKLDHLPFCRSSIAAFTLLRWDAGCAMQNEDARRGLRFEGRRADRARRGRSAPAPAQ